jgi:hypothetical protein
LFRRMGWFCFGLVGFVTSYDEANPPTIQRKKKKKGKRMRALVSIDTNGKREGPGWTNSIMRQGRARPREETRSPSKGAAQRRTKVDGQSGDTPKRWDALSCSSRYQLGGNDNTLMMMMMQKLESGNGPSRGSQRKNGKRVDDRSSPSHILLQYFMALVFCKTGCISSHPGGGRWGGR